MKVEELMVGDWVKYTLTDTPIVIKGLVKYSLSDIYAYVYANTGTYNQLQCFSSAYIEPIEITEEFLLKNGFRRKEFQDRNVFMIFNLCISVVKVEAGWFINVAKANEDLHNFTEVSVLINYVHELQHILRLIGIEKEVKI